PDDEGGLQLGDLRELLNDGRQFLPVVDNKLGRHDDHPAFGAAVEGLVPFVQEGQQFAGKGDGRTSPDVVLNQLDAYFGRVRHDDLHIRVVRQLQNLLPLITCGKDPADRTADDILFDFTTVFDAPDADGIETILPVESARVSGLGRFDRDDASLEQSVPVGLIDEIIRESPQQHTGAELQHSFRKGKKGWPRYDDRAV